MSDAESFEGYQRADGRAGVRNRLLVLSPTGLTGPTARRIAEEHGGGLTFQSEEGKGTNFVLRLPLAGPPDDGVTG